MNIGFRLCPVISWAGMAVRKNILQDSLKHWQILALDGLLVQKWIWALEGETTPDCHGPGGGGGMWGGDSIMVVKETALGTRDWGWRRTAPGLRAVISLSCPAKFPSVIKSEKWRSVRWYGAGPALGARRPDTWAGEQCGVVQHGQGVTDVMCCANKALYC